MNRDHHLFGVLGKESSVSIFLSDSLFPKETTFLNSRASHTRICTSSISSAEIIFFAFGGKFLRSEVSD